MSGIIQQWLSHRLGIIFEINTWDDIKGGILLAQVLQTYDLFDESQVNNIRNNIKVNTTNEYLRCVIVNLGIECSNEEFNEILAGKKSTTTRLLYQLYLALHDKSKLHFVVRRKINNLLMPDEGTTRFKTERVEEVQNANVPKFCNPLATPLVTNAHIISWHKTRYELIMEHIKTTREKYTHYMNDKFVKIKTQAHERGVTNIVLDKVKSKLPDNVQMLNLTYEQLLEEQKKVYDKNQCLCGPNYKEAKKIVNTIKRKRRKEEMRLNCKAYFAKMLLRELWEKRMVEQEDRYKNVISQKMVQQSIYEQQMTQKMFEVHQTKNMILANRDALFKAIMDARSKHLDEEMNIEDHEEFETKIDYYIEKNRVLELHNRLFAEKLRRRSEKHFNLCREAVDDIVDISLFKGEYKEQFHEDLSRRKDKDLSYLFIKSEPIFPVLSEIENVIQYEPHETPEELEQIYICEILRQNAMDQLEFESYNKFQWPWEINLETVDLVPIELGQNVLGFIVHRLLLAKYPKKPLPPPANIPKTDVAVCVNGINNLEYLPPLQRLLLARGIHVIVVQDAINYCLEVFKKESTTEYMDGVFVVGVTEELVKAKGGIKSGKKGKDKKRKADKKGSKVKGKKKKKVDKASEFVQDVEPPITFADKINMTPIIYPCEELVLSDAGALGEQAFGLLNLGESINDCILSAMIVEYLKTFKNINGWVLINYPQTATQAALFEECLTSIRVPPEMLDVSAIDCIKKVVDFDERSMRSSNPGLLFDLDQFRQSEILPDPDPEEIAMYDTFLTAYIEVKKLEGTVGTDVDEEYYELFKHPETDTKLNQFYMDQGCKYTLYYKAIDYPTVKHLGKLIIGDYSIPPKTSLELFTDTLDYVEAEIKNIETGGRKSMKVGDKKAKPQKKGKGKKDKSSAEGKKGGKKDKKGKSESGKSKGKDKKSKSESGKSKGKGKGKKGKSGPRETLVLITHDEETQFPELIPEPPEIIDETPEPRAGERGWCYIKLPIPDEYVIALATLWENTEETYIIDFQQLCFLNRILQDSLVPYMSFVYNNMLDFISRPDNKQIYLHQFQTVYNNFDADLREDDEVKAEIHCRINEFREKLWSICDERMRESVAERKRIIQENWTCNLLIQLTNIFMGYMQLEIDRCSDSLQLMVDYYNAIVTTMPYTNRPFNKIQLELIHVCIPDSDDDVTPSKYVEYVENLVTDCMSKLDISPFEEKVVKAWSISKHQVTTYKNIMMPILDSFTAIFNPKGGKKGKGAAKKEKSTKPSKAAGGDASAMPKFLEPVPEVKDQAVTIIEEFACGLNGEILRTEMRLDLIKNTVIEKINGLLQKGAKTFHTIFNDIDKRYKREVQSVQNACEVFYRAVEAEIQLQPELIFDGDILIIDPNTILFDDELPRHAAAICERDHYEHFTITQLNKIVDILSNISPSGLIPERTFVFLLQDILVKDMEDGSPTLVPTLWAQLEPHKTSQLSEQIFGNSEYIDWKDFIIYNLNVRFPNEAELMQTRIYLRAHDPDYSELVYDYQFYNTTLWYEDMFDMDDEADMFKKQLIKELLVRLFKITGDRINYTAMLLYFCKDQNPVLGFAKALELSIGKMVCWDNERGEDFREIELQKMIDKEMYALELEIERKDTELMAEETVVDLIDLTVHRCESVFIEELLEDEPQETVTEPIIIDELDLDDGIPIINATSELSINEINKDYRNYLLSTCVEDEGPYSQTSNVGFECVDAPLIHFIPFDVIINIIGAALPWHSSNQNINYVSARQKVAFIYEKIRSPPHISFNGMAMTHTLLNDEEFIDVLDNIYKFHYRNPSELVKQLVGN